MKYFLPLFCLAFLLAACGGGNDPGTPPADSSTPPAEPAAPTRPFYMGFTPWPYDATIEAVETTYRKIRLHGDLLHYQLMQGIPWQEAYDGTSYPNAVENDLQYRAAQIQDGKQVLLSLDSLNAARNGLANNWGANGEEPRPAPWNARDFDDQEVIDAYVNFALDLIDRFQPRYFNYATEASLLITLGDDLVKYNRFKIFAREVYARIKQVHPDLELLVSVSLKDPGSDEMAQVKARLGDILDYVDVIGVSVYPYAFFSHAGKGDPNNLPADWLSQIEQLAPGKPVAITETGWIAEDLVIPAYFLNVESNQDFQQRYVRRLLRESEQMNMRFVLWWSLIDFQALWEGALLQDDIAAIWRDIGLYDETVTPRAALAEWDDYLARPRQ